MSHQYKVETPTECWRASTGPKPRSPGMTAPNAGEPAQAQSLDLHVRQHPMLANQHRPKASISTYDSTQCWRTSTGPKPRSLRMTAPNAGKPAEPSQAQSLDLHVRQHPMLANQHRPKASISTYDSTQCWRTSTGPKPRSLRMTAPNTGKPAEPSQAQSLDHHV